MSRHLFSNGTEYEIFNYNNCTRNGGDRACWHDRNESCGILAELVVNNDHPAIVGDFRKGYRCTGYKSMTDGRRDERAEAELRHQAEIDAAHGGGLFPREVCDG